MLLPSSQFLFKFRKLPLFRFPLVSVGVIEVDVVEMKDHVELASFFGDILTRLLLVNSDGHLSDREEVTSTEDRGNRSAPVEKSSAPVDYLLAWWVVEKVGRQ
jgi:hypothetical protein